MLCQTMGQTQMLHTITNILLPLGDDIPDIIPQLLIQANDINLSPRPFTYISPVCQIPITKKNTHLTVAISGFISITHLSSP